MKSYNVFLLLILLIIQQCASEYCTMENCSNCLRQRTEVKETYGQGYIESWVNSCTWCKAGYEKYKVNSIHKLTITKCRLATTAPALPQKCIEWRNVKGRYDSEVSWKISNSNGVICTQNKKICCGIPGEELTVNCFDSYGDGWNDYQLHLGNKQVCSGFTGDKEKIEKRTDLFTQNDCIVFDGICRFRAEVELSVGDTHIEKSENENALTKLAISDLPGETNVGAGVDCKPTTISTSMMERIGFFGFGVLSVCLCLKLVNKPRSDFYEAAGLLEL